MAKRSSKRGAPRVSAPARGRPAAERERGGSTARTSTRIWALVGSGLLVALVVVATGWAILSNRPNASPSASRGSEGTVVEASGGHWTNISPDTLAAMLEHKDFTLLNVKTPYIGEIAGTDLYIPYTDVAVRAGELPSDRTGKIVVYCRSGRESAIAAQALIDLGYTDIDNLDGGMAAWTASGRQLVHVDRPQGRSNRWGMNRPVTFSPIRRAA